MNHNKTDITIVLDKSSSMSIVYNETITGFNAFVTDQKAEPGEAVLSLHTFSHLYDTVFSGKKIADVEPLTKASYKPEGYTALLDAIGTAINSTGERLRTQPDDERAGKVVFVIITDGEENSSKVFTKDKINEMINHQRDIYKWQFVFIGANQDGIQAGTGLGVAMGNTISAACNDIGTRAMYSAVSDNVKKFRGGQKVDMSFEAKQRKDQLDAGAAPDAMSSHLGGS